jgi:hypothetical protein
MAGESVAGLVADAWDVDHGEPVTQSLLLQIPESGILDVLYGSVPEQFAEGFVVDRDDEVIIGAAEDKVSSLVQCISDG